MFTVKICGVRQPGDVDAAVAAGADAIGLNFFPPSVRYVAPEADATRQLSTQARDAGIGCVGVFVNESAESIAKISASLSLTTVQLHGDESLEEAREIRRRCDVEVLRAIKLPRGPLTVPVIRERSLCWVQADFPLLLDADAGAAHGGSGQTLDWGTIRAWAQQHPAVPWVLAGGLNPDNIGLAIEQSGARGVDTASGVEHPKGHKSPELIHRFVTNARAALAKVNAC